MALNTDKKSKLICQYCGDTYTRQAMLDKHVTTCEDNPANGGDPKESLNADLTNSILAKDPSKMTEIERLEYELAQKKLEAYKIEASKKLAEDNKAKAFESKGIANEPLTAGKFRVVQVRDHSKLHVILDEQDQAGYSYLSGYTLPSGITFIVFVKRG